MSRKENEISRAEESEIKKKKGSKVTLLLVLVVIIAIVAIVMGNVYKGSGTPDKPDTIEEVVTSDEAFDLTTNEGIVKYVDHMMSGVMISDEYTNGNWLARKHYVYTQLLKLEEEELIKAIHYDTPTRSFSIEHVDGSVRWYAISDKEK